MASDSDTDTGYGAGGYGDDGYGTGPEVSESEEGSLENTILINGIGTTGGTEYEFTVSGSAKRSTYRGASINKADVIDGGHVTGSVTGWQDAFRFSGELETLTVDGDARVSVNGSRIDPDDYDSESTQVLTIVGNGTHSVYEVTASDSIDVINGDDVTIVGTRRAEGTIERGVHRLRLHGKLDDVTFLEGGTQVYLDTRRLDLSE
ncbi:hypothetical protein ACFQHN_00410 [Natrialbaceae archaeon GCM10025896]